jgi:hypothetical protein
VQAPASVPSARGNFPQYLMQLERDTAALRAEMMD